MVHCCEGKGDDVGVEDIVQRSDAVELCENGQLLCRVALPREGVTYNGDEEEEPNRHEVTFEDFLNYVREKPEWLYGKLRLIHERFEDVVEDCEARLAESELSGQAKDGEIVLMKNQLEETTEHLNQMTLDHDAYTNKIAYDTLHHVDHTTAGG